MKFGQIVKNARIRKRLLLRDCASELGVSSMDLSKVERGVSQAPLSASTLERWADILGIRGADRAAYMDAAEASRNDPPPDIQKEENLLAVMPAFLRLDRDASEEELAALADGIRVAYTPSLVP